MTQQDDEAQSATTRKFRIGERDDLIVLLHERGDTSQTICERFGLSAEEVEAAILRFRSR